MAFGKRFKDLADKGRQLQQQAMAMQEQAMAMQQQAAAMPGSEGGWDPKAFMLPPSEFVKTGSCEYCGAAKQLPTVREYLYCDFCGQLYDYDLQRAAEAALSSPTVTTYAQIANQIGPEAERVRQAGDRQRYRDLQQQLHAAQAEHTPWAVPPRAWNDQHYRSGWVDYSTAIAVAAAFDPKQVEFTEQVRSLSLRLQWKGGMGLGMLGGMAATVGRVAEHGLDMRQMTPKVEAASFWPLADTVLAQSQHLLELIQREGIHELDPDQKPPSTSTRMTSSGLAQGWLKHLEPEDGQEFIARLGLRHEYERATVQGELRHCAGCGYDLTALPGATRIVCDACGRAVDLAAPQVTCQNCNNRVAFIDGVTHVHCPFCATEIRRV